LKSASTEKYYLNGMSEVQNTPGTLMKGRHEQVSILDESLFTGGQRPYKLLCTVDPELISIAAIDTAQNKFTGFEGFPMQKPQNDDQLAQKIAGLTHQSTILKKVDFRNVSVQFTNTRFTFIPSALYKQEDAAGYFYFNHRMREGDIIYSDPVRAYEAVSIFAVPDQLVSALKRLFENFSVHHHLTALLTATRFYSQKQAGKALFIHVRPSSLDVLVTDERKFLFANTFAYKSVEDAVYFIMMVCEQLSLNPEKAEVVLSGEVEKGSALNIRLHTFLSRISFAERIRAASFTYGFDELPAHFYHSEFSHILCES
jgi:hypothetical protein